jgi:hypothetical protein
VNVRNDKHGQMFSTDAIVAMGIFVFIIIIYISLSSHIYNEVSESQERNHLLSQAQVASDALFNHPGNPTNWTNSTNISSIFSIGVKKSVSLNGHEQVYLGRPAALEQSMTEWDLAKVLKFEELNLTHYNDYKKFLAIDRGEIYVEIFQWTNNEYVSLVKVGNQVPSTAKNVIRLDRYGIINDTWGHAVFHVWTNCGGARC